MSRLSYALLIILSFLALNSFSQEQALKKRPKVGLVLSGGGAKGFAHIGVLKVLEEVGMPIDYIGGTSMGSIVGGLYAIGYSADSIKKLTTKQDWIELFTDRFPRKYLSFEEKQNDGKFFIPFPMNKRKFQLPSGVMPGQSLGMLLTRIMWKAQGSQDFSKFPIPFLCVACDIERGTQVVFTEGSLPEAIRASMSIPTAFVPVNFKNQILVDGGIINNFPVDEVKSMGADIVIGIEVGVEPYEYNKNSSIGKIVEQSLTVLSYNKSLTKRKKCDIYMSPDLSDFNISSFDAIDSLIDCGERTARMHYAELKHLADSLRSIDSSYIHQSMPNPPDTFLIADIAINGIKSTTRSFVLSRLNIQVPSKITLNDIEEAVKRTYGSQLFQRITYNIIKNKKDENVLELNVFESSQNLFSVGINYNSEFNASLYLNTVFHNVIRRGSKLSIDLLLGENPKIDATYLVYTGWDLNMEKISIINWRWDLGLRAYANRYRLYGYNDDKKTSSYVFNDITQQIFTQTVLFNSYALGLGLQHDLSFQKNDINLFAESNKTYNYLSLFSNIRFDTYNRVHFPTHGGYLDLNVHHFTEVYNKLKTPLTLINSSYSRAFPFGKKIALKIGADVGISIGDTIPETYIYRAGGIGTSFIKNAFPFYGVNFIQYKSKNLAIGRLDLQWELFRKNFIILSSNVIHKTDSYKYIAQPENLIVGYAISYGILSVLGPAEFTVMQAGKGEVLFYFNLGFRF